MKTKKIFAIAIVALLSMTTFNSCGGDDADEPKLNDPTEEGVNPNAPGDESDDGDTSGDEMVEGDPEPLTEYLRAIYTDGKRWEYAYNESIKVIMEVNCDTIVEGESVKYVSGYSTGYDPSHSASLDMANYISGVIKEDGGRVYKYGPLVEWDNDIESFIDRGERFIQIYNVTPTDAEEHTCYNKNNLVIVSVGTINLQGKLRRCAKVWSRNSNTGVSFYDYHVEGIGPLFGQVSYCVPRAVPSSRGFYEKMVLDKCYDGDELIYDASKFSESLYTELERFTTIDLQ